MHSIPQRCQVCQTPIHSRHAHPGSDGPTITGRLRHYCSDTCRKAASRQRQLQTITVKIRLTQDEQEQLSGMAQANGSSVQQIAVGAVRALLVGQLILTNEMEGEPTNATSFSNRHQPGT